jgi:hypothetical protein
MHNALRVKTIPRREVIVCESRYNFLEKRRALICSGGKESLVEPTSPYNGNSRYSKYSFSRDILQPFPGFEIEYKAAELTTSLFERGVAQCADSGELESNLNRQQG